MFVRFLIAVVIVFGAATGAFAQAQPAQKSTVTAVTPTPDDRARQWLVLVDDKNYAQSWSEAGKAFQNEILAVGFAMLPAPGMRPGAMMQFVGEYGAYCLREIRLQILVADIKPKHDLMRIVGCAVDAESRDDDIRHIHHDNVDVAVEQYAASLCRLAEHSVQALAERRREKRRSPP